MLITKALNDKRKADCKYLPGIARNGLAAENQSQTKAFLFLFSSSPSPSRRAITLTKFRV